LGQLRNGGFQTWHGHLAREKRAFSHEMPQGITGKMPVPRLLQEALIVRANVLDCRALTQPRSSAEHRLQEEQGGIEWMP
jgi:hypothetical protein